MAIFKKSANWLDWPCFCYCSPPFPLIENDQKWLYQFLPIKHEPKIPSVEMACDLGIQNEIPAVCNV